MAWNPTAAAAGENEKATEAETKKNEKRFMEDCQNDVSLRCGESAELRGEDTWRDNGNRSVVRPAEHRMW